MPEALGFQKMLANVFDAPTGAEMMERAVKLHGTYTARIDSVAQVLEGAQYQAKTWARPGGTGWTPAGRP